MNFIRCKIKSKIVIAQSKSQEVYNVHIYDYDLCGRIRLKKNIFIELLM